MPPTLVTFKKKIGRSEVKYTTESNVLIHRSNEIQIQQTFNYRVYIRFGLHHRHIKTKTIVFLSSIDKSQSELQQ